MFEFAGVAQAILSRIQGSEGILTLFRVCISASFFAPLQTPPALHFRE